MGCVVLGYDDSLPARAALQVAIEQAKVFGDELVIVFGGEPPGWTVGDEVREHRRALEELGTKLVEDAKREAADAGVEVETLLVPLNPPPPSTPSPATGGRASSSSAPTARARSGARSWAPPPTGSCTSPPPRSSVSPPDRSKTRHKRREPHPLDPPTAEEFRQVRDDPAPEKKGVDERWRFASMDLKEPAKAALGNGGPVPREARVVCWDRDDGRVYKANV